MFKMHKRKEDETDYHRGHTKLILVFVFFVSILSALLGVQTGARWQEKKTAKANAKEEITSDILEQQLKQIGEMSTVKYIYTNMGKYENTKQFLSHDIPLTTKSFTISYDGTIKAGVELDKVTFKLQDNIITVTIPESTVLSNDADMDSVIVYDEKSSIFNGLSTEDITDFLAGQEDKMEQKAITNGILKEADDNAISTLTTLFTNFLKNGGFAEEYKLNVIIDKNS